MNNGPDFTYELAIMRLNEVELLRTGRQRRASSPTIFGQMRMTLGTGLMSVGRWLAGSGSITPVAGTR